MRRVSVVLVAVVAWTGGGLLLVGQRDRAHDARLADTAASVRALLDEAQENLRLDARLLARDLRIVEHEGEWVNFGHPSAIIMFSTGRRAERWYVLAPGGKPMAYQMGTTIPAIPPPDKPIARLAVFDGRAWMLGVAPFVGLRSTGGVVPGALGVVILARSVESLAPSLDRLPPRPALLVTSGDRALLKPAGAPETGWDAATRDGRVAIGGEPRALRRVAELQGGTLWTLVPEGEHRGSRRRLTLAIVAGDAAGLALAASLALQARRR